MSYRLMNFAAVSESNFNFGGVNIDVNAHRVDLYKQHIHGLTLTVKKVFICAARRMHDDAIAHIALIDVSKLMIGT